MGAPSQWTARREKLSAFYLRDFHFLDQADAAVVIPMQLDRSKTKLGGFGMQALARMRPGITLARVNADLTRMIPISARSFPVPDGFSLTLFDKIKLQSNLRTLKQDVIGNVGNVLWVLMGSIAIVLLVAVQTWQTCCWCESREAPGIGCASGARRGARPDYRGAFVRELRAWVRWKRDWRGLGICGVAVLVAIAPTGLPRLRDIGSIFQLFY